MSNKSKLSTPAIIGLITAGVALSALGLSIYSTVITSSSSKSLAHLIEADTAVTSMDRLQTIYLNSLPSFQRNVSYAFDYITTADKDSISPDGMQRFIVESIRRDSAAYVEQQKKQQAQQIPQNTSQAKDELEQLKERMKILEEVLENPEDE